MLALDVRYFIDVLRVWNVNISYDFRLLTYVFILLASFEFEIFLIRWSGLFGLLGLGLGVWVCGVCGILGLVIGMIGFTFLGLHSFLVKEFICFVGIGLILG